MPELKGKKATYIEIDYSDFEKFVNEIYGVKYSFLEDLECGNDCFLAFTVERKWLDTWEQDKLKKFISPKGAFLENYMANTILKDLCNNGYIEPGKYLFEASY